MKRVINNYFLILSWAVYDLANQFFALNIVSLYFVRWLILEKGVPELFYGIFYGASMFFVAVFAPIFGLISDFSGRKRIFLIYFTLISIIFTFCLGFTYNTIISLVFFAIANFACQTAVVFYNSLMANIIPKNKTGLVSGLGRMFSYFGAVLSIYFVKPIVENSGYHSAFLPTAALFLVFSLPCMIFVKDVFQDKPMNLPQFFKKDKILEIIKKIKPVTVATYKIPGIADFLKSIFFVFCAVNVVIIFMSLYATKVFLMNETQVINLIVFSTVFAVIGSFLSGFMSDYLNYRLSLTLVYALWIACFLLAAFAINNIMYFLTGALAGLALGSIWAVTRAFAVTLIPRERLGEMFGLFNLVVISSNITGVIFWGVILLALRPFGQLSYRIALLSLNLFMVLGLYFLLRPPLNKSFNPAPNTVAAVD